MANHGPVRSLERNIQCVEDNLHRCRIRPDLRGRCVSQERYGKRRPWNTSLSDYLAQPLGEALGRTGAATEVFAARTLALAPRVERLREAAEDES